MSIKDGYVRGELCAIRPATVVDFGAGAGKMGELCREELGSDVRLTAVEGCASTVDLLKGKGIYDQVEHCLLQEWVASNTERFDLAIFGDVLEHVTRGEAFATLNRVLSQVKHVIVNVPLRNLQQDGHESNPLEEHRAYLFERDFDRRYIIREKHLVGDVPGYMILNVWITGRRHLNVKGWLKDTLLATLGRRGKWLLERLGYDAFPRANT
ncbi:MAG: methyltransferase domain-containing protein [Gemmataceae bacterium]